MLKPVLGTVQFGLDYGIANNSGRLSKDQIFQILDLAVEKGVNCLDTAPTYGDSEKIIGEYISQTQRKFFITTKIPSLASGLTKKEVLNIISTSVENSLKNLKQSTVHSLLLHNSQNLHEYPYLKDILRNLKNEGVVKEIGISGYNIEDDVSIVEGLDSIQYPTNLFDHQLISRTFTLNVYLRSVLLQGLLLLSPEEVSIKLHKAVPFVQRLWELSLQFELSIKEMAFGFVTKLIPKGYVVFGVLSPEQLEENLNLLAQSTVPDELCSIIQENFANLPMDIKNPSKWQQ